MPRYVPCAVCGVKIGVNKSSRPEPTCQPCRRTFASRPHEPSLSRYQRGCRCDGCRRVNTEVYRKRRGGVEGTARGAHGPILCCTLCNVEFRPSKRAQRLCSEICRIRRKRMSTSARRAALQSVTVSRVVPAEIFERDGWRCYLCLRKLLPTHVFPHRRAATIDHVIPISKGGAHEPANVRTACHACNAGKGNRGGNEQLLLIG